MRFPTLHLVVHALATLGVLAAFVFRVRWNLFDGTTGWLAMLAIALGLSLLGELAVRRINPGIHLS